MLYKRSFCIKVFLMVCLSIAVIFSFPVFAVEDDSIYLIAKKKKAEDEDKKKKKAEDKKKIREALKKYQEAQKAALKGDLKKAIKQYKEAIKENPTPGDNYYPYLELGVVYFNTGDIEKAQYYCEQSKKKGAAPEAKVDKCLTVIAQHTKKEQVVEVVPTPTPEPIPTPVPEPTPTPQPPAPEPQPDTLPIITIKSQIPAETESEILTVEGTAVDDQGVKEINISVRKAATRALVAVDRVQMVEQQFTADVQLDMGPNEIIIEATDTIGQVGKQVFTILRKPPEQPDVAGTRGESAPMPEPSADSAQQPRNVYAVVIGIGDYQDERIPDLRFTVNDALGMYDVLIDPQYGGIPEDHIQLLLDEDATTRNIRSAIGTWLRRQAKEEDTVIIYYAGHGSPDIEAVETYWVTHDTDIDDLYATALSNDAIADMLARLESKRVLTFLDSCYSAATVKRSVRTRAIVNVPLEKFTGEGRVVISASDGQQLSLEMEAYEHGVFTYYLLEGLKGQADGTTAEGRDGIIEVEEIWNYVRNQVTDTAKKQGNTQTPKFQGSLTAGFPLTFDREYLEELHQRRLQEKQEKEAKLQELFEQKLISAAHFDCAFQMLEAGKSDGYLDGLLAGEISPETFSRLFKCEK